MKAIEAERLQKTYRVGFLARRVHALNGVDLSVNEGEVFGIIGPNGAGKSTAIKILVNLVWPGSGSAKLFGLDVSKFHARDRLGYVPENPVPYEHLTGREYLELQAALARLPSSERAGEVKRVLERVEMATHAGLPIRKYSKGMVQRVMLAGALLGKPRIIILDEPTSGLDPLGRRLVSELILEQRKAGVTILFCTHIISDVESLCDRAALMVGGKIAKMGAINELVSAGIRQHEVVLDDFKPEDIEALAQLCEHVDAVGGRAHLKTPTDRLQELLSTALGRGLKVIKVAPLKLSLEDTFIDTLRDAKTKVGATLE